MKLQGGDSQGTCIPWADMIIILTVWIEVSLKVLLAAKILPSGGLRCTNNKQRTPHNHKDLLSQSVSQSSGFLTHQNTFYVSQDSFIRNELWTSEENTIIRRKFKQMHIAPNDNESSNRNANAASLSTVWKHRTPETSKRKFWQWRDWTSYREILQRFEKAIHSIPPKIINILSTQNPNTLSRILLVWKHNFIS